GRFRDLLEGAGRRLRRDPPTALGRWRGGQHRRLDAPGPGWPGALSLSVPLGTDPSESAGRAGVLSSGLGARIGDRQVPGHDDPGRLVRRGLSRAAGRPSHRKFLRSSVLRTVPGLATDALAWRGT